MSSIDIIFILDASGSMFHLRDDTVGGFNKFIEDQRSEPGQAFVTLVTFDNKVIERYAAVSIENVPKLTHDTYMKGHGGMTALLDAVGKQIAKYESFQIRADKTMFVITTDGIENASREYRKSAIAQKIKEHTKKDGWLFVFLGANASEWQGHEIGATVGKFDASPVGVHRSYATLNANTRLIRAAAGSAQYSGGSLSYDTTDDKT